MRSPGAATDGRSDRQACRRRNRCSLAVGSGETPRFALFAENNTATADLVKRFEGLLDPDIRPTLHEGGLWVVRPDGYVACSSRDVGVIAEYLEGVVQRGF
jgi:hypothetical protein